MAQENRIANLFPTPVWAHPLEPGAVQTLAAKLGDALASLGAGAAAGPWRSEADLQRLPEFVAFAGVAKQAAVNVLAFLQLPDAGVEIDALWAEALPAGASDERRHPAAGAGLRGVYVLAGPAQGDLLLFEDPKPALDLAGRQPAKPTPYTARTANMTVAPGTMVVFPGWLPFTTGSGSAPESRARLCFEISVKGQD